MTEPDRVRVGTLAELAERGCLTAKLGSRPVCVFYDEGNVYAVEDRCPHMGFPLRRGTVQGGLLTCHWHHARFDLASGGTLDPFADDVPAFAVPQDDVLAANVLEHGRKYLPRLVVGGVQWARYEVVLGQEQRNGRQPVANPN